jgi:ParB/RepB/Spo0J family partition protein
LLKEIPVSDIEDFPLRISSGNDNNELYESMALRGQLSPIRVRLHPSKKSLYQVVFGNRRLSEARRLGWPMITAEIVEVSDHEALLMAFAENEDRRGFSDYEKALLIQKIHQMGQVPYGEVAKMLGKSAAFVSQHIAMLKLFPSSISSEEEVTKVLCSITERHARALSTIEDPIQRWNTAKFIVVANLGVRELHRYIKSSEKNSTNSRSKFRAKKAIMELLTDFANGFNERDMSSVCGYKSERSFSLFGDFPPFEQLNFDSTKEHILGLLQGVEKYRLRLEEIKINVSGTLAYSTMYAYQNLEFRNSNISLKSRLTIILEKKDQDWKIVHEHWSAADPSQVASLLFENGRLSLKT